MTTNNGSTLKKGISVLGKLFTGTRRGPSGERIRQLKKLQKNIGVRFTDVSLLEQALTHRSYSHVTSQTRNDSNERMEFLGDSVLGLSVSQFLYLQFPDRSEGALSKMKSLLVSRKVLSSVSREIGFGEFLLLSGEESDMGGRDRTSILADSFEGVIGAIYLDQGYRAANKFVMRFLLGNIHEILKDEEHTNYKSLLQEYVQSKRLSHPVYRVRREEGPEHEKEFAVDVVVRGEVWGSGRGKTKKDAEQYAAKSALERRQGKAAVQSRARRGRGDAAASEARGKRDSRSSRRDTVSTAAQDRGDHGIAASREKLRTQRRQEAEEERREGRDSRQRRRRRSSRSPGEAAQADSREVTEAPKRSSRRRGGRSEASADKATQEASRTEASRSESPRSESSRSDSSSSRSESPRSESSRSRRSRRRPLGRSEERRERDRTESSSETPTAASEAPKPDASPERVVEAVKSAEPEAPVAAVAAAASASESPASDEKQEKVPRDEGPNQNAPEADDSAAKESSSPRSRRNRRPRRAPRPERTGGSSSSQEKDSPREDVEVSAKGPDPVSSEASGAPEAKRSESEGSAAGSAAEPSRSEASSFTRRRRRTSRGMNRR